MELMEVSYTHLRDGKAGTTLNSDVAVTFNRLNLIVATHTAKLFQIISVAEPKPLHLP